MESAIIIAIITVVGQVVLFLLQKRLMGSQIKKTDAEASSILIERALNLSKQEIDTLTSLYGMLKEDYKKVCIENNKLDSIISNKEHHILALEKLLQNNNINVPEVEDDKEGKEQIQGCV